MKRRQTSRPFRLTLSARQADIAFAKLVAGFVLLMSALVVVALLV